MWLPAVHRWDHPREYGENDATFSWSLTQVGSSPRIRGEYPAPSLNDIIGGIIPANTGRISHFAEQLRHGWDHPREYGENSGAGCPPCFDFGSSPRIRGEWCCFLRVVGGVGIIPANTGRISGGWLKPTPGGDHPREYGENIMPRSISLPGLGSSPRIRGEFLKRGAQLLLNGIIPANTGRIGGVVA